jgi:hypothetical protein
MTPTRGVLAGICGARQAPENIDVSSGTPVTNLASDFARPLGAVPLTPFLEQESTARAHLLQLVVDAASVPAVDRPIGLRAHLARLWEAIASLEWTESPSTHRRLVPDPAAENRQLTTERFLALVDRPDPAPRTVSVDRLREPIAIIDKCLQRWPGGMIPADARRTLDLVRAELVVLVTP